MSDYTESVTLRIPPLKASEFLVEKLLAKCVKEGNFSVVSNGLGINIISTAS